MPVSRELEEKWEAWKRLHVLASEMESAAIFTVSAALGARSGAIFHTVWNQERFKEGLDAEDSESHDTDSAIRIAIDAIKLLIERDRK